MDNILEEHLHRLALELQNPDLYEKETETLYHVSWSNNMMVSLTYLDPGIFLTGHIWQTPKKDLESFFMHLCQANYLGQGTGQNSISLDKTEKFLTLSQLTPIEINYLTFRECMEEFLNYLGYWQDYVREYIQKQGS